MTDDEQNNLTKQTHKQKPREIFQGIYNYNPQNKQMCIIPSQVQCLSNLTMKCTYKSIQNCFSDIHCNIQVSPHQHTKSMMIRDVPHQFTIKFSNNLIAFCLPQTPKISSGKSLGHIMKHLFQCPLVMKHAVPFTYYCICSSCRICTGNSFSCSFF